MLESDDEVGQNGNGLWEYPFPDTTCGSSYPTAPTLAAVAETLYVVERGDLWAFR